MDFYKGKKISLTGVVETDYTEHFVYWANDPEFKEYLSHGVRPTTKESVQKLYKSLMSKDHQIFSILDLRRQIVGIIGLYNFNWLIRSVELCVHLGKDHWGKGYASEAIDFLLKHGFETLGLNKIWLGVAEPNIKAHEFYLKKGFKEEGRLRDQIYRKGRYHNNIIMSRLRNDEIS